ncbi:head decoration protein [Morganella morganii]|uniref:head decoration protein n=1 Tax=Morganella morganii TaxID=582 RepID=UPI003EB9DAFE
MEQFSQNPFRPGVTHSVFNLDQLISGPLQVVTDTGIIAKGGLRKRGTILGVVAATGEYEVSKKDATDGSEKPSVILVDDVDTTDGPLPGGLYLMGEFNQNRIIHDESWTAAELKDALRQFFIFLRDSVQA